MQQTSPWLLIVFRLVAGIATEPKNAEGYHGAETQLKLPRIAADYDWMAMRAAAFELQHADELARSFAKSNTKRLIGSANLIRSPDTSRSSP